MFNTGVNGKAFRNKWNLNDNFVVTYTGALGMANDLPVILKAADRLKDQAEIKFLFVGDGKERQNLELLAEKMNLKNAIFTGSVPKSEMPDVIAASNVCIATLQKYSYVQNDIPQQGF